MKKWQGVFITITLFALVITLSGCDIDAKRGVTTVRNSGIAPDLTYYVNTINDDGSGVYYSYLIDNRTGVVYLRYREGFSSGIIVMLNTNGTPVTVDRIAPDAETVTAAKDQGE